MNERLRVACINKCIAEGKEFMVCVAVLYAWATGEECAVCFKVSYGDALCDYKCLKIPLCENICVRVFSESLHFPIAINTPNL